jgi:hypothetical protein
MCPEVSSHCCPPLVLPYTPVRQAHLPLPSHRGENKGSVRFKHTASMGRVWVPTQLASMPPGGTPGFMRDRGRGTHRVLLHCMWGRKLGRS